MLLRAFAKLNLSLRVLGRRADGYHDVHTILQTIDWWDEIEIELADQLNFSGPGTPEDESNLVVRAVRAFQRLTGVDCRLHIRLKKSIPIGSGLGGGSSDAAVTLMGLQRIYKKTMVPADVLAELRRLGSDVPFFCIGGLAEAFGRGDEVVRLEDAPDYWLVIVDPDIVVSTADAYSWLTTMDESNSIKGFDCRNVHDRDPAEWWNDFELPLFERYPQLLQIKSELTRLGAYRAALSGSGSAVYGQFRTEAAAVHASFQLNSGGFRTKTTRPLPRSEYFERMVEE